MGQELHAFVVDENASSEAKLEAPVALVDVLDWLHSIRIRLTHTEIYLKCRIDRESVAGNVNFHCNAVLIDGRNHTLVAKRTSTHDAATCC